jgi:hypothetical protein
MCASLFLFRPALSAEHFCRLAAGAHPIKGYLLAVGLHGLNLNSSRSTLRLVCLLQAGDSQCYGSYHRACLSATPYPGCACYLLVLEYGVVRLSPPPHTHTHARTHARTHALQIQSVHGPCTVAVRLGDILLTAFDLCPQPYN